MSPGAQRSFQFLALMIMTYIPTDQTADDLPAIETLLDVAFGIARRTKTSYRLREGSAPQAGLSLVVREEGFGLVGALSFWPLAIGPVQTPALLLGPLAVHPQRQNLGIGRALMNDGIARATLQGHSLMMLIGDAPYYARVGFQPVPQGQIDVPGPVDAKRLLALELVPGTLAKAHGLALASWRWAEITVPRATTSGWPRRAAVPG